LVIGLRVVFKIVIVLLILAGTVKSYSQKGNYFLHNYLPAQYNAADQNRCIIQDLYGRIFVANNDGVLINNGAGWEKMDPYFPFLCLSLAKDESEQIFVAGDGNFGKIVQNTNGAYRFESLVDLLPQKEQQELGRFWTIITLKGHVYFCSNEKIIDYDYKTLKIINAGEEGFHTFYKIGNTLVLREKGAGLKFLFVNNQLEFFRGGQVFADNSNPVRGIIKGSSDLYYIITPNKVFEFYFNTSAPELSSIKETKTPIDEWLSSKTVYCASNIGQDYFAFGSVNGGLLITDKKFNPVKYINSNNGLQDDGVNYIYNDSQGHIWLALAKGISFIEFNSPLTLFTKSDGIKGTIEACIFFQNTAYLATDKGVLKYNPSTLKFESTNLAEASWCLATSGDKLLAGTRSGLYLLDNNKFSLLYETPSALHSLFIHPVKKNLIYLGTETGYAKGKLEKQKFTPLREAFEMNVDIRTMAMDRDSGVYFATTENGLYVQPPLTDTVFGMPDRNGMSTLKEGYLFTCNGEVLLGTESGVSQIIKRNGSYELVPHPAFELLNNKQVVIRAITIHDQVWITTKPKKDATASESFMCLEKIKDQYVEKPLQLSRIKESNVKSFCFNDSLVYIGTNNGLYCYDLKLKKPNVFLNTFVNYFLAGKDSSHYYYHISPRTVLNDIVLDYKSNSILVKLGASDYIDKNELLFSYYLKGRDNGYNSFANKKEISLERLYEGDYVFYVKSKNILGIEGQEIKISFTILPPWYRTIWAYILYTIAFLGIVYLIIKLNVKRLREQNIKLENIITDRTKEIHKQKLEIEHKNQEITDSINYAKGIQDSILPGINEIKKAWSSLFVFFQPKDIVSGDFYWFKQVSDSEFLIACCDCTGHGVPGGFMSMICSDKLHDAAKQTTDPGGILYLANNSIKETLRQQNEGKSKDGMEICLLLVNIKTRNIKYAGANRPLWIYHKTTNELTEIKPTKASIASFTEFNYSYATHEVQLNEGDCLYASTDGYADQFGGPDGKKYMSKNLKNLLVQYSVDPMDEIGRKLEQDIRKWMDRYEQVDDLLVIGIKL
jgi:serine phosphatase RsbU (regulator of sigma subunit)/ligand-binding sensor domain-containing protein